MAKLWRSVAGVNKKMFIGKNIRNRVVSMRSYKKRSLYCPGMPTTYIIETTNACNQECPMCIRKDMTRPIGAMSLAFFKKIIDQIYEYAELVFPFYLGEPLLNPEIVSMISYCTKREIKTSLFTNGTIMSEGLARDLARSGLGHIQFSVDSVDESVYSTVRSPSRLGEVLANVEQFLMGNNNRVHTTLSMIEMKPTQDALGGFIKKWKRYNINIRYKDFSSWGGTDSSINCLAPHAKATKDDLPCDWQWRQMTILHDGRVVPCYFDFNGEHAFGNCNTSTVDAIWNGESLRDFRARQIDNKRRISLCTTCSKACIRPVEQLALCALDAYSALYVRLYVLEKNY